jgi:hypothetical protein
MRSGNDREIPKSLTRHVISSRRLVVGILVLLLILLVAALIDPETPIQARLPPI